jgi:4-hydroxy-tetrahydrodipicolinate synthase
LPGFNVFAGTEQYLLATLRKGGPGCISAVANVTIGDLRVLMQAWNALKNDPKNAKENEPESGRADALQEQATKKRLALQAFPTIPALKEIMALRTGNEGWRRVRPPLVGLGPEQAEALALLARDLALV